MLNYDNKIILAPMVRVGTLPMRLLALRYGADIVYSEELIDWKFLRSKRSINEILNTVDYVDQTDGTIVFRTCSEEKGKVVLQLGTCDAERALKVAKLVENDVAAIDINMGCPKEFSIKGGMGVALMAQPNKACNILKTLVSNLSIPVTCKIRIFESAEATLHIVERLMDTGITAIAIHGRTRDERPQHPVHTDIIHYVADRISIPVIANGGSKEIEKYNDIMKFKELTGCSSVMLARAAEWNCSIFRKEGMLPMDTVIKDYLKLAVDYDNSQSNTKYCVQNILRDLQETPRGRQFLECQTLEQICSIWELGDYCNKKQSEFQRMGIQGRWQVNPDNLEPPNKKFKSSDLEDVMEKKVRYTGYRDRPPEERQMRFTNGCREGHTEIAFTTTGTNLQLVFDHSPYNNRGCDFQKENGKAHIVSRFIMNGVCVRWRGWIDLERLDGAGCLELDEDRAAAEDASLREQIERYNQRLRDFEDKQRAYREHGEELRHSHVHAAQRCHQPRQPVHAAHPVHPHPPHPVHIKSHPQGALIS